MDWLLDAIALAMLTVSFLIYLGIREMNRHLLRIETLTRDARAHQGSIGKRTSGPVSPHMDHPKQVGPRDDLPVNPATRQGGVRFERKGGAYGTEG